MGKREALEGSRRGTRQTNAQAAWPGTWLRDEDAAGSNPATPTATPTHVTGYRPQSQADGAESTSARLCAGEGAHGWPQGSHGTNQPGTKVPMREGARSRAPSACGFSPAGGS